MLRNLDMVKNFVKEIKNAVKLTQGKINVIFVEER